ncbi:MAG: dTMP kinase [Myxococcota bacterium]
MSAHFIAIEGIDGAGTTTQAARVVARLGARGVPARGTREPTGGPIGTLIRQALTGRFVVPGEDGPAAPGWETMALLFAADRLDHGQALIAPSLQAGVTVVTDRYVHSSVAYQSITGGGTDAARDWVKTLNRQARRPDLTIVLDVDPAVARARRLARSDDRELYDDDALQRQLAAFYADIDAQFPGEPIVHVDANRDVPAVELDVLNHVRALRGEAPLSAL